MARPEFAITQKGRVSRTQKKLIGLPATEAVIRHGLDLIGMYINDYCYMLDYDEMLEQMLNYNYENKRKFDIIAAMLHAEIADEELIGIVPVTKRRTAETWRDLNFSATGSTSYDRDNKWNLWNR